MKGLLLCPIATLILLLITACDSGEPIRVDARDLDVFSEDALCAYHIGDPLAGEIIFNQPVLAGQGGCITCHSVEPDTTLVGPSLNDIASIAGERIPGVIAANYIYVSIVDPDFLVVDGFSAETMPQGYQNTLSEEDITNIVSYLMTLITD